jgi:hypothetical protein
MEYLFGFIFTLFKIAIQASFYATAATWLIGLATTRYPNSALRRIGYDGWLVWQHSYFVAFIGLFLFSCTYWGDHGLGDSARIPLGHGEEMSEINGNETFFEGGKPFMVSDMAGSQQVDKFQVANNVLCAQAERKRYFIYNLATKKSRVFTDSLEYNAYAAPRGLPASNKLQSFWRHYKRYWGGWRFWLLA